MSPGSEGTTHLSEMVGGLEGYKGDGLVVGVFGIEVGRLGSQGCWGVGLELWMRRLRFSCRRENLGQWIL